MVAVKTHTFPGLLLKDIKMMLCRQTTHLSFGQNSAIIRPLDSLWAGDVYLISKLVETTDERWSVQTGDDYDGYLFMLIEPTSEIAECQPSYLISGKTGRLELAAIHGDECKTLGRFCEVDNLVSDLNIRLR